MMAHRIRLGISTCPNDTFTFHALIHRLVDWRGLDFEVELLDIQQLNDRLFQRTLDVAKVSFHAALRLADQIWVLPTGSALGFGVGPLLLASAPNSRPLRRSQMTGCRENSAARSDAATNSAARSDAATTGPIPHSQVTLCPGEDTTATLLFKLFHPETTQVQQVVFSEIMPRLKAKRADFGVCIHEGRFTWESEGLYLVEDLGTRWEAETHCPLPLGGIVGLRDVGLDGLRLVQNVIHDSLQYGFAHRQDTLQSMRKYAQELSDDVLFQHVDLYVNDWTFDLGRAGQAALDELSSRAIQLGLVDSANRLSQLPF